MRITESEVREAVATWIYNVWNESVDASQLIADVSCGQFDGYVVEVNNDYAMGLPK